MRAAAKLSVAGMIVAAFVAGLLFASGTQVLETTSSQAQEQPVRTNVQDTLNPTINSVADLNGAFAQVASRVNPSVVQVVTSRTRETDRRNPFEGTPFEDFFRMPERPQQMPPREGLGSGVIVRSNGYVVTNNHVVEGAEDVEIHLSDGATYDAEIVGTDPATDLAVVKIDAEGLPTLPFGAESDIQTGHWVMAVGSPFSQDLGNSVTSGIISATGRSGVQIIPETESGLASVENFIQTDAAINPGNSGGALVDLHGRLLGINTAILSRSGGNVGIGFAIPVDIVQNAATQIIDHGYVARGFLGIAFQGVTRSLAQSMDIPTGAAEVMEVRDGTPADEAGLEAGDVIVSVDGQTLRNPDQLASIVAQHQPGTDVDLTLIRNEERMTLTVTLGERPDSGPEQQAATSGDDGGDEEMSGQASYEGLGLEIADLTNAIRQQLEIPPSVTGVVITSVDPTSDAYRDARLRERLVIGSVEGQNVESVADFQNVYETIPAGDYFRLRVHVPAQDGWSSFQTALVKPE